MKVVITGGAGFIGSKLAHVLLQRGHDVTLLDNLSPQIHGDIPDVNLPDGASFIRADMRDLDACTDVIGDADAIYHLAAETGTGQSMYEIEKYVSVNEMGTANLLQALSNSAAKPRKLILASSRSVYGEGAYRHSVTGEVVQPQPRSAKELLEQKWELRAKEDGAPLEAFATPENLPFLPGSVYAATKAAQELLLYTAAPGLSATANIFRFQNVYGEGQSLRNPYTGIISIFYNRARQDMDIPLYEDGLPSRDFVHVDDITRPLADALEADLPNGTTLNLGAGKPTTIQALAEKLCAASGFSVPINVTGQYRVGDIRHCWADLTRAHAMLGFVPEVSLEQGLGRFTAWASTQPAYQDASAQALLELKKKGLST